MRVLYWLLGAAAAMIGTALIVDRKKARGFVQEFRAALAKGAVVIDEDDPHIFGAGLRGDIFKGTAAGHPFAFRAVIDASGTRHGYVLAWAGRGMVTGDWNAVKDGDAYGLRELYLELQRLRPDRKDNTLN